MSSFNPSKIRKAIEEFTPRRPQKFQKLVAAKDVIIELRQKGASYRSIADLLERARELETKVGATFGKEDRYHHLVKRRSEIEEQLDPTKNQAQMQAESPADDENAEKNSRQQTQTKVGRQTQQTQRTALHV